MRQVNYAANVKIIMPLLRCLWPLPYVKRHDNANTLATDSI